MQLQVQGTTEILGIEVPVIEGGFGSNQKVMLSKTIAEIHDTEVKHINELIKSNIDEFEEGVDIIDLKAVHTINYNLENLGMNKMQISKSQNIYLLSEQGYIKLYSKMRNKDENIFNLILNRLFKSKKNIIGFAHNKEIRFREILSGCLRQLNYEVIYQYNILKYRIDIYIPKLNIAIEYDENNHNTYTYEEQELRQRIIEKELNCEFIRVSDDYSIGDAIGIVLAQIIKVS